MQYATPEEIYLRPATVEIARLFGDPTINLHAVEFASNADRVDIQFADMEFSLPTPVSKTPDQELLLGIRPEFIRFCSASDPDSIKVEVEAETPLNEKIVTLVVTENGQELLVSRPSFLDGPSTGSAYIQFSTQHLLLFDKHTGQRESSAIDSSTSTSAIASSEASL